MKTSFKVFLFLLTFLGAANPFSAKSAAANSNIDTILSGYQLQRTSCKAGSFVIISFKNSQYCAFPTLQHPAGIYRINPDTFELHSVGGSTNPHQNPVVVPPPPNPGPVVNPGYSPGGIGGPIVASPSIFDNFNQYNSVPPAHEAHIRSMLSKRNISLAPCNQTPLTIFTIGRYTACAYPTANYPAGRYQVEANLPF